MDEKDKKAAPAAFRYTECGFRWEDVEVLAYKDEGAAPFKDITRQVLFRSPDLACELRYFEMAPGGYSTLERHEHVHGVMIYRGEGTCLVGGELRPVQAGDLIYIPPMTWHQFRAGNVAPFGFLCMVNANRDRPQLPTPKDLEEIAAQSPRIAAWLKGEDLAPQEDVAAQE